MLYISFTKVMKTCICCFEGNRHMFALHNCSAKKCSVYIVDRSRTNRLSKSLQKTYE